MNGIEFAILLKASYPSCQFLLFFRTSGHKRPVGETRKKGHRFGVLAKPLHPAFMSATVSEMLTPRQDPPKPNMAH